MTGASPERPERVMVRRALAGAAVALPVAGVIGWLAGGSSVAASAALGVAVVAANFAANGLSLAWAAGVSVTAVQAVALGGFVVRMGVIVAVLFALDATTFFSPLAFGIAAGVATVVLLVYEARIVARGIGANLEIPADPVATRAAAALAEREAG